MQLFSNNGSTLLAVGISNSAVSLTVDAGTGGLFPAIAALGDDYFTATLEDSSGNYEIVKCTVRPSGSDIMTIVRGHEGTTQYAFNAGARVELRTTKGTMDNFVQRGDDEIIDGGTF